MNQHAFAMKIEADPDRIWALISDLTNIDWMPLTGRVEVEGSGPGMRRRLYSKSQGDAVKLGDLEVESGPDNRSVVERLVSIDPARRQFVYCIEENNPMPVSSYLVTVDVEADPSDGSLVRWTVDFETEDEAIVVAAIDAVYTMIGGWLADATRES
jgi:hypothetical protein